MSSPLIATSTCWYDRYERKIPSLYWSIIWRFNPRDLNGLNTRVWTRPVLVFANFYFFHFFSRHFLQQYRRHRIHSFTNTKHTTTLVAAAVKKRTEGGGGGVLQVLEVEPRWSYINLSVSVAISFFSPQQYIWWQNDKGFLFRHIQTEKALIGAWRGLLTGGVSVVHLKGARVHYRIL